MATPEEKKRISALIAKWDQLKADLENTKIDYLWELYEKIQDGSLDGIDEHTWVLSDEDKAIVKFCVAYSIASAIVSDGEEALEE